MPKAGILIAFVFTLTLGVSADISPAHAQVWCGRSAAQSLFCQAQTWVVTSGGPTPVQAGQAATALGLPEVPLAIDGALRWLDAERFQFVPTMPSSPDPGDEQDEDGRAITAEALHLAGLAKVRVLNGRQALARAERALSRARLLPRGAQTEIGHSRLELVPAMPGSALPQMTVPLDTHVSYHLTLGGVPYVGPGAKVKVVFDGDGRTTQFLYALRGVVVGPAMPIVPPADAEQACTKAYRLQRVEPNDIAQPHPPPVQVSARLVYYAPPLSLRVRAIYPHYLCSGQIPNPQGGENLLLRNIVLPAVLNAPVVRVSASTGNTGEVIAQALVTGGAPPYSFQWSSDSTTLDPEAATAGPSIAYQPAQRLERSTEEVNVVVTDANGLTAVGSALVPVAIPFVVLGAGEQTDIGPLSLGRVDVGTEWVGSSQGLDGSAGNAQGWMTINLLNFTPVAFNLGDFSAFERDFKDASLVGTGDDHNWVDNVDMVFYTGHANGDGWNFSGNEDDGLLHYGEARYGNRDVEWLGIAACGPLQEMSGGFTTAQRWGPAFDRLHILMGYATVSGDNTDEGQKLANYMHGSFPFNFLFGGLGARRIRQAWAQMAIDVQTPDVIYGMMGPVSTRFNWNYNDSFWGRGATTSDISPANTIGYWILRAPS